MKKIQVPLLSALLLLSLILYRYAGDRDFLVTDTQADNMTVYKDRIDFGLEYDIDYSDIKIETDTDFDNLDKYDKSSWSREMTKYAQFRKLNTDVVGYINIEGTKVDYPVLWKQKDNDYYLRKGIDKEYLLAGSIYMDGYAHPKWKGVSLIHGHSMKDGSMFRSNLQFVKQEYFEKHKRIKVYTGKEDAVYEVFSTYILDANRETVPLYYDDLFEYEDWLEDIMDRSVVKGGVIHDKSDILVMNQCSYQFKDAHTIVVASRVK